MYNRDNRLQFALKPKYVGNNISVTGNDMLVITPSYNLIGNAVNFLIKLGMKQITV